MEKTILIKKPLIKTFQRKLVQTSVLVLGIPQNWVHYFNLSKDDEVELELTENGFIVKVKIKKNTGETSND